MNQRQEQIQEAKEVLIVASPYIIGILTAAVYLIGMRDMSLTQEAALSRAEKLWNIWVAKYL